MLILNMIKHKRKKRKERKTNKEVEESTDHGKLNKWLLLQQTKWVLLQRISGCDNDISANRLSVAFKKCRGSKTPCSDDSSANYNARTYGVSMRGLLHRLERRIDAACRARLAHNPASNDLPRFHPFEHSNRQLFTRLWLTGYLRATFPKSD